MKKSHSLLAILLIAAAMLVVAWFLFGEEEQRSMATPENVLLHESLDAEPASLAKAPPLDVAEPQAADHEPTAGELPEESTRTKRTAIESQPTDLKIRGVVLDELGNPVQSSIRVICKESAPPKRRKAWSYTDSEGRFETKLPRAGEWSIRVRARGHHSSSETHTVTLPQQIDRVVEFRLTRESLVEGHVLDPQGLPVSDARVELQFGRGSLDSSNSQRNSRTDREGYFAIKRLHAGVIEISAEHESWAASLSAEIELAPDEIVSNLVLVLRKGGAISGVAYERDGSPARQHEVQLEPIEHDALRRTTMTDSAGRFAFKDVTPGEYMVGIEYAIEANQTTEDDEWDVVGWINRVATATLEVKRNETCQIVVGGLPASRVIVHGRVTRGGKPLPRTFLVVAAGSAGPGRLRSAIIGEDGTYEVTLDKAGEHQFVVMEDEAEFAGEFSVLIPKTNRFTLNLALPSGAIRGRILEPDGSASEKMRVVLARDDGYFTVVSLMNELATTTDESGHFEFENLRNGQYALSAGSHIDYGQKTQSGMVLLPGLVLAADAVLDGIELRLPRSGSLTATVKDSTGAALPRSAIFVRDVQGQLISHRNLGTTDSSGKHTVRGIPAGDVQVTAQLGNLVTRTPVRVRVTEGEPSEVALQLERGTRLEITTSGVRNFRLSVRDSGGLEYATMIERQPEKRLMTRGFSPTKRLIGPLPPGKYTVVARSDDGREVKRAIRLNGEPERALELRFR